MPVGRTLLPIASSGGGASERGIYVKDNNNTTAIANVVDWASLSEMIKVGDSDYDTYMVATGDRHLLAIRNHVAGTGGELWVLGINTSGSIGGGTIYGWRRIGVDSDWTWISACGNSSYAIRAGRLYVTGENSLGQLGDGTGVDKSTFTQIGSDTDWEMTSTGLNMALAIKGGDLLSTGSNVNFMTGFGTNVGNTLSWTVVDAVNTWSWIGSGRSVCGAITSGGELYTWGQNLNGVSGQGTSSGSTTVPTQVGVATDWYRFDSGNQTSYASKTDGTLWGCGLASSGSIWGPAPPAPNVFTQDSSGATDWDWFHLNSGGIIYARKTNGTLWSSGIAFMNANTALLTSLTQVGTDTNWSGFPFGNKNGFAGEIAFIKTEAEEQTNNVRETEQ
jgi:alpha-tubulin suppressor-like RCC1 family protein